MIVFLWYFPKKNHLAHMSICASKLSALCRERMPRNCCFYECEKRGFQINEQSSLRSCSKSVVRLKSSTHTYCTVQGAAVLTFSL